MAENGAKAGEKPISDELLEILRCPVGRHKVKLNDDNTALVCVETVEATKCPRTYRIENGIPVMLIED